MAPPASGPARAGWRPLPHAVLVPASDEPLGLPFLLGASAGRLAIRRDPGGRPRLDHPAGISFSRRDGLVLVGAAPGLAIGVDLERVSDAVPGLEIAEALFAPAEAAFLRAAPARGRGLAFAALWTGKEAVLKALGRGIARDGVAWPRLDRTLDLGALRRRGAAAASLDGSIALSWHRVPGRGRGLLAAIATMP